MALVEMRNMELESFADMAAAGNIDAALDFIQAEQHFRNALWPAGSCTPAHKWRKWGSRRAEVSH